MATDVPTTETPQHVKEVKEESRLLNEVDMARLDPCRILGVSPEATELEIAAAYKQLSGRYHPCTNPKDASIRQKFHYVSDAHRLLTHPKKGQSWRNVAKLPELLSTYTKRPHPPAFLSLYTAIFDVCTNKPSTEELDMLKRILCAEVSEQIQKLAASLEVCCSGSVTAWLKEVALQLFQARNRLYLLQAGSDYLRRCAQLADDLDIRSVIAAKWQEAKLEALSKVLWQRVTRAVEVAENSQDVMQPLAGLADVWSRCGGPVTALLVPIPVIKEELACALRALCHKFLSPPRTPFTRHASPSTLAGLVFSDTRKNLISMVLDHLSEEDIVRLYGLNRSNKRMRRPLLDLSS